MAPLALLRLLFFSGSIIGKILSIIIYLIIILMFISGVKKIQKEYSKSGVWNISTSIFMIIFMVMLKKNSNDDEYDDYDEYDEYDY